jgi:RHS repeat-associated protein
MAAINLIATGLLAVFAAQQAHAEITYIPARIEYQEGIGVPIQRNYKDPDSVCVSLASQLNAFVLASPPASGKFLRVHPYSATHPSYGLVCYWDYYYITDWLPYIHAGDVQPNQMQTAVIQTVTKCPTGYGGPYRSFGPPSYDYCTYLSVLTRETGVKNCPATPKPCAISAGLEILSEPDYSRRSASALEFTRYYRSSPSITASWQAAVGRLGYSWSDTYSRSVTMRAGSASAGVPDVASVTRPTGHEVMFYRSAGAWVSEGDTTDRLTQQVDGSGNTTGWQYRNASDDSVEAYDASGRLVTITSRSGVTQSLIYSTASTSSTVAPGAGFLILVTDSFGNSLSFTYDYLLRISTITEAGAGTITYAYDSNGNLASVTYPDATVRSYLYNEQAYTQNVSRPFSLTGVIDENNSRYATIKYDTSGRVASTELAGGVELYTFNYGAGGATTTVADAAGSTRVFSFTKVFGRAAGTGIQRSCAGCSTVNSPLTPDANGNVSSKTDFNGRVTNYTFDLSRNLETSRTEAYGTPGARTIGTAWHSTFRLPTSITEPNRTTSFTHDANGNVLTRTVTDTSVTPNVSRTWTYTFNAFGQVLTEDGPRTDVTDLTTYTYYTCMTGYQCGQLYTITNAAGQVTTYNSYNAHGQPTQITDSNGLVTTLGYDMRQRLTDRCTGGTLPGCSGGELTQLTYWPTGLLKRVTNPDASYIEYSYDAAHRLIQIQDGALNKIVYTLDAMGNRTAENTYDPSNALRRTHTRIFNTLNQLWKDVNAAGSANVTTIFGYDNNGNQTTTNAPLGRNSTSLYDELNRLKQIADPASGITQFGYDANDNLTSVTDPRSLVTNYTYSGFGDLKTQTSPDTGLTTNTYDSGGNLDTSTDSRSAITDYDYDALNRVTSVSFTKSGITDQTITYGYDAGTNGKGHLTSASDADHNLAWSYDSHGRITGKGQTVSGVTLSMGYGYNAAGQLSSTVLPSGAAITYGYNTNGQVTSLTLNGSTTILSGITYDPFGPITGWTWGNGTTASRGFDADGKITQVDNANGASLKNYAYDDAFRVTGIADAGNSALSWTYGYDLLDRLNSATSTGVTQGWTYDANGNRLTETGSTPASYTNSGTSNRVSSISGTLSRSYGYDNAGNTLSYAGATFTYSNRGRMATASNGGVTATYTYNALGQRIRRATSSATTLYLYDEAGHLAGEYTSAGALIQETVWLGDMPVATLRPIGLGGMIVYYVHADHLNTPRLVTDTANNIRWRWDSDAFGTTAPNQNPAGLGSFEYKLRFPGQQYDPLAGLNYNYFRDYDPATGRYDESDPIGIGGGLNSFRYGFSNPLEFIDPEGLAAECTKLFCTPKAMKERITSKELPVGAWQLENVSEDPMRPRNNGPLPEKDPLGTLAGKQTALCLFGRTHSFRDTHMRWREWSCMEYCYGCDAGFRNVPYSEYVGEFDTIRRKRETQTIQVSHLFPWLKCREILRELR